MSRELLPAATRRENQELKTDAPSGHGLAAAFGGLAASRLRITIEEARDVHPVIQGPLRNGI
jgi:hypothetical protein